MVFTRILIVAALGLSACAATPNDVSPDQQIFDDRYSGSRQAALNGQIQPTGPMPPSAPGATADAALLNTQDIASRAEDAILAAEAESAEQSGVFDNIQPQMAADVLPAPVIPRVAAFAIRTSHAPGERVWRRNPLRRAGSVSCAVFPHPDVAQDRFLAEGGPERDPLRLDPDGDGFVCGFDPSELRAQAAQAAGAPAPQTPPGAVIAPPRQISTEPRG